MWALYQKKQLYSFTHFVRFCCCDAWIELLWFCIKRHLSVWQWDLKAAQKIKHAFFVTHFEPGLERSPKSGIRCLCCIFALNAFILQCKLCELLLLLWPSIIILFSLGPFRGLGDNLSKETHTHRISSHFPGEHGLVIFTAGCPSHRNIY